MEILQVVKGIDTVISVAKPILEVVTPKLQESMKGFAERMLELSEKYPSLAEFAQMLDKAADIMGDILYALGVNTESADVLGAKVAQADKGIDSFNSAEEYITYLKNEIELDKVKFDVLPNEEKIAYTITGMTLEAEAISEKLGIDIPVDVVEMVAKIVEIGKIVVEAKELITIISEIKTNGINNLSDVCDCINGKGDSDRIKTGQVLVKVLDGLNPGQGNQVLNEIIDEIRE